MTDTRLVAYAPNGALLGPLPAPLDLQVSFPLNDLGALSFSYDPDAPLSSLLGQPSEVVVQVSTDSGATWTEPPNGRFLYLRDGRDPAKDDLYSIECPGYVYRLSKAVVPFTGLDGNGNRTFTNATPGQILNTLLSEAQARGALAGISWTFGAVNDTAGTAWPAGTQQTVGYAPGTSMAQVLQGFADAGLVDYRMNGRVLQMYVTASSAGMAADRTLSDPAVTLRAGRDLTEAPFRRTWENVADTAYVQGDGTSTLVRTNAGAITPWGRQETHVSAAGVTDTATLTIVGDGALSMTAAERVERTYGLTFGGAAFLPFRDYAVGEWVYASSDGVTGLIRQRVRQITLTQDANGLEGGNVILNDKFTENDIGQQRAIERLTSGATQGGNGSTPIGNDILPPAAVTGASISSTGYIDGGGNPKARITISWTAVTTNADGTPASDIDHYEVQRRRNGATTWEVYRDAFGTTITDSPYEPGEQWQFQVRAVDQVYNRGGFSSTLTVTTANDSTPPAAPSQPTIASTSPGIVQVTWNGLNNVGAAMDADLDYVEVHVSTVNAFTPTPGDTATMVQLFRKAGAVTFNRPAGQVVYVRLIARDTSGNPGGTGVSLSAQAGPLTVASATQDGLAPTIPGGWAPNLRQFAVGALEASWDLVTNADPVLYDVYVAEGAPVAVFDATTLSGTTADSSLVIRGLPDGTALLPDTDYYLAVKVRDGDGTAATTGTAGPTQYRKADVDTISADYVYAGDIEAQQIKSGNLEASLAILGSIATGTTGRRVVIDQDGLRALDALNAAVVNIPTDAAEDISLNGNVTAQTLTAIGKVALRATDNEVAASAAVILQQGVTQPATAPTVTQGYGLALWNNSIGASSISGINWYPGSSSMFVCSGSGTDWRIEERSTVDGSLTSTILNASGQAGTIRNCVRIGTNFYITYWVLSGGFTNWYVQKRAVATPTVVTSTWQITNGADTISQVSIGLDGSNLLVGYNFSSGTITKYATLNPDTGAVVTAWASLTNPVPVSQLWAIWKGSADLGASHVITLTSASSVNNLWAFATATNTRNQNAEWPQYANGSVSPMGLWYDGTKWQVPERISTSSLRTVTYDGHTWTTAGSTLTLKVTTTWYDGDTSGSTTTHETPQGPIATLVLNKRARIYVTTPAVPSDPSPVAFDDPDRVRIYVGTGTGTRTTQWLNATGAVGATSTTITGTLTFAGTNPPATNNFPASTPGAIASSAEESAGVPAISLKGDGTYRLGDMVDGSWITYTPAVDGAVAMGAGDRGGRYKYIADKTVYVEAVLVVGTGANWGAPSAYLFTLPVPPVFTTFGSTVLPHLGPALLLDSSASTAGYRTGTAFLFSTTGVAILIHDNAAGAASSGKFMGPSVGFSGGVSIGDIIRFSLIYEVA